MRRGRHCHRYAMPLPFVDRFSGEGVAELRVSILRQCRDARLVPLALAGLNEDVVIATGLAPRPTVSTLLRSFCADVLRSGV